MVVVVPRQRPNGPGTPRKWRSARQLRTPRRQSRQRPSWQCRQTPPSFAPPSAPCASAHAAATPASPLPGLPVVTTPTTPAPSSIYRLLAQVTTPSDALPGPSQSRPRNTAMPSPAPRTRRPPPRSRSSGAPPRAPEQGLNRRIDCPPDSAIDAKNGCSRGKQQTQVCTQRAWCPASLEAPATPRRVGRTETLTGHATHTSNTATQAAQAPKEAPQQAQPGRSGTRWRRTQ